ncbi:MAG: hypothetical protein HY367_01115 [Candidatus Aenigmarchaeota archaeon]|nr:hypothetical protein [Candidatus Aenigmarchaeota archaeon]
MKGTAINILTAFLIAIAFFIFLFSISFSFLPTDIEAEKLEVRVDTYSMENALRAAKIYLDTGFRFSAYQAMHDTGANGGWDAIPQESLYASGKAFAIWSDKGNDTSPAEEQLEGELAKAMARRVGEYRGNGFRFLNDYEVRLPPYKEVRAEFTGNDIAVSAVAENRLSIGKTSGDGNRTAMIEKSGDLKDSFSYPYLALFREAKRINSESGPAIATETQRIIEAAGYPKTFHGTADQTCEEAFTKITGRNYLSAGQELGRRIAESGAIGKVPLSQEYVTESLVLSSEVEIIEASSSKNNLKNELDCEVQYRKDVAVMAGVSDGDESRRVPVYDGGKTTFAPLGFSFVMKA